MGKQLFDVLAMISEFEADILRMRACEGMEASKAKGRLRRKKPQLAVKQEDTSSNCIPLGNTVGPSWLSC